MGEIDKAIEYFRNNNTEAHIYCSNSKHCDDETLEMFKMNDLAIQALEEKKQREWVKCSERLPTKEECQKNDCRFIVTDGNRRYQAWFDCEDCCFIKCNCDGLGLKNDNSAIAWQSLPQPYKEAENETD